MNKVFFKRLSAYLIVLTISFVTAFSLYIVAFDLVENRMMQIETESLHQKAAYMNQQIDVLHKTLDTITVNQEVNHLAMFEDPYGVDGIFDLRGIMDMLYNHKIANPFILDLALVLKNGAVVTTSGVMRKNHFFKENLKSRKIPYNIDEENLLNKFIYHESINDLSYVFKGQEFDVKGYVQSLGMSIQPVGMLIILVDEQSIFENEQADTDTYTDYIFIDENNHIYDTEKNDMEEILLNEETYIGNVNNQLSFVSHIYSENIDWQFISIRKHNLVMKDILRIRKLLILMIFLSVLVSLIIVLITTFRSSKRFINIQNSNRQLSNILNRQRKENARFYIRSVYRGEFHVDENSKEKCSLLDIKDTDAYRILIARVMSNILGIERIKVVESIKLSLNEKAYIDDQETDIVILLYNKNIEDSLQIICNQFEEFNIFSYQIGIGKLIEEFANIHLSYDSANRAMEWFGMDHELKIVYAENLPKIRALYTLNRNDEEKLGYHLREGDEEATKNLISKIYDDNNSKKNIHAAMYESLLVRLLYIVFRSSRNDDNYISKKIEDFSLLSIQQKKKYVLEIAVKTAISNRENEVLEETKFREELIDYLKENYNKTDMSLALLADCFEVSEVYISRYFSEKIGINFFQYLQKLRMDAATELLAKTDKTVKEIVDIVGYTSVNTFGKAFKRQFEITPIQYRRNHQK